MKPGMSSPSLNQICCPPCIDFGEEDEEIVMGNAFDVIVVQSNDGFFSNENFVAKFPKAEKECHRIVLEIGTPESDFASHQLATSPGRAFHLDFGGHFREPSTLLGLSLLLLPGRNPARYLLIDEERIVGVAHANIFLWSTREKVVVSDIDGTITKSNVGGIYDTLLTETYCHCHEAVCQFFSTLAAQEQTQVLYVTSRPIALASRTRKFLNNLRQQQHRLPEGPLLGFRGNFAQLLMMELVSYRTHHFKAEILWNNVVEPFRKAGLTHDIFHAAFGNTIMDCQAAHMVSVPLHRIFIIQKSKIHSFDKECDDELLHLSKQGTIDSLKAWGSEMPREWYRRKMGSKFDGYGDPKLRAHILVP